MWRNKNGGKRFWIRDLGIWIQLQVYRRQVTVEIVENAA
jgi:hypothetical protein